MKYTILVDSREKTPLPIPESIEMADFTHPPSLHASVRRIQLKTRVQRLPTADYALANEEGVAYQCPDLPLPAVVVETKRSLQELAGNTLDPHKRKNFILFLQRMQQLPCALLAVEGGLSTLYPQTVRFHPGSGITGVGTEGHPANARDHFLSLCLQHRVHPYILDGHTVDARRRAADFVVRMLILGGTTYAGAHYSADRSERAAPA